MSNPEHPDRHFADLEPEFGDVIDILRSGPLESPSEAPGPEVWNRIATELGGAMETVPVPSESADRRSGSAEVVSLAGRRVRNRRMAIALGVAAAILLVAVPLTLALRGNGPDGTADLVALGTFDGSGRAELNGRRLTVELDGPEAGAGSFYELWLLDLEGEELRDLVSLGRVTADGTFAVPDDIDLNEFDVVDVSIEPDDGNPDHSGDSILRGGLTT